MSNKRIDFSLLDDNMKTLINAAAKIFPIQWVDIVNNINANNYEYVKPTDNSEHKREIYFWNISVWELIGADDLNVEYSELKGIPLEFTPSAHAHEISEVNLLQASLDAKVDEVIGKQLSTEDFTTDLKTKLVSLTDNAAVDYSAMNDNLNTHVNNGSVHVTTQEKTYISNVPSKADTSYVNTQLALKADTSTLSGHTGNTTIHVNQTEKDTWNAKANIQFNGTQPANAWWVHD